MTSATATLSDTARGGTGLLAVFVDLAEEDRADFRPFLVEVMFGPRAAIGFGPGASFDRIAGDGQAFATLYEMPNLGFLYGAPYQALRQNRSPRDTSYHEKFQNQDRYTLAWTGPELSQETRRFSPFIFIDRFDLAESQVQDFNIWFACTYLPALTELPGIARVRRYLAMEGGPAHFVLHELSDADVTQSTEWSELRGKFGAGRSGLYERIVEAP